METETVIAKEFAEIQKAMEAASKKSIDAVREEARYAYEANACLPTIEGILTQNEEVWSAYLSYGLDEDQQDWLEEFLEV